MNQEYVKKAEEIIKEREDRCKCIRNGVCPDCGSLMEKIVFDEWIVFWHCNQCPTTEVIEGWWLWKKKVAYYKTFVDYI